MDSRPCFFSFVGAGHARPARIRQTVICGKIEGGSAFIFLQPYPPLKLRRSALYTGTALVQGKAFIDLYYETYEESVENAVIPVTVYVLVMYSREP